LREAQVIADARYCVRKIESHKVLLLFFKATILLQNMMLTKQQTCLVTHDLVTVLTSTENPAE